LISCVGFRKASTQPTGDCDRTNIPIEIQEKIEGRSIGGIKAMLNAIKPAPLFADGFPLSEVRSALDSTIGHDSIPNYIHGSTDSVVGNGSTSEISTNENVMLTTIQKSSFTENSTYGISLIQVASNQISTNQITPEQINTFQISISDNRTIQPSFYQGSTEEIGSSQISETQISSTQVDIWQDSTFEVNEFSSISSFSNYDSPSKVSLTGSVFFQQLFSGNFPSHNIVSNFVSNFKYSATDLWQSLFDSTFNITLQITDLPTGQLAEAQITQFDLQGRPNGGTLLIDHDANGVGWFIDTTPWENSEFAQTLADTAYRATTGDASGKYDLLTTILHETGHLLGIINGNPGFDSNVKTLNSKKVFVGKDFTANLSPDGSHLDAAVHPYDLMNNTLAPGVRKLPSLLNQQIINAIRSTNTAIPQSPTNPSPQPFFLPVTPTNYQPTYSQPIIPITRTSLAPLTAILLADITNGNFNETDTTKPENGTYTITWDFGDSVGIRAASRREASRKEALLLSADRTTATGILNPTHSYNQDGVYISALAAIAILDDL
jgi:hypothetical protein